MPNIAQWLENNHLSHPVLALIPLTFGVLVGSPIMGAAFATGFYYGREVTHASLPTGSGKWYRGFQFKNWSRDNHLDFWPVLILSALVVGVF